MPEHVLLALSSFRFSEKEIEHALNTCRQHGCPLTTVFVVDVNVARYFVGTGVMAGTSLREQMEQGIMDDHRHRAQELLGKVCRMAAERNIECEAVLRQGRFAAEVRAEAARVGAQVIIVTRAQRPEWLRRLFGSPVDRLCDELGDKCNIDIVK